MNKSISEWKRMVSGFLYNPADPEIAKRHHGGMIRCDRFNRIPLWRGKAKQRAGHARPLPWRRVAGRGGADLPKQKSHCLRSGFFVLYSN